MLAFFCFLPIPEFQYWLYRPEVIRCIFLGFGLFYGIGCLCNSQKSCIKFTYKSIYSMLDFDGSFALNAKKSALGLSSVCGLFRAAALAAAGRFYGVRIMTQICNA